MIPDLLTLQLFGQFPRIVGNPIDTIVFDIKGLKSFLSYNEGVNDCFVKIYPLNGMISMIYFDFDGFGRALEDAKTVFRHLVKNGHTVVPVASGMRGIHLYNLLTPHQYPDAKKLLTSASYRILIDTFGDDYVKSTADPHCIGDINRFSRLPNTRRPPKNASYCVALPPEFLDMTWKDVVNWSRMPHEFSTVAVPNKTLYDFKPVDISKITRIETNEAPTTSQPMFSENSAPVYLESQLRPCIFKALCSPNPLHYIRVAATADLLRFWKPYQIADMYSQLKWLDWDYDTSMRQIHSCMDLKEYSCTRLKLMGACLYNRFSDCPMRNPDAKDEE
jgi:hypothetical protein